MKRNKFNLSHTKLFSYNMGDLVPIGMTEVLPGDTLQHGTHLLVRAAPLLAPPMHPCTVAVHHWFVPFRILWSSWEDFITGGPSGTSLPSFPIVSGANPAAGSLSDYLGVPPPGVNTDFSVLPFRAYNLIWNEFYRDQDLQTPLVISLADGADGTTTRTTQQVSWEKDYFTSARPWEVKGPTVTVPLGTTAPVKGIGAIAGNAATSRTVFGSTAAGDWTGATYASDAANQPVALQMQSLNPASGTNRPQVFADLTNASSVTVNQLRLALALQRFEEARARYGSRYVEYLRYLGVRSSDARLQRPEYLGGGREVLQWSEVLQTAADGANPVSTIRGHGISAMRTNRYRRFFEEHGLVMTLMYIRPRTIYNNMLKRTWNRRVKEDFWQRELQHIGQQAILNKEVRISHATPNGTFGYQDRYDEYRREESDVAGDFRTSTLNYWHFARDFAADPALNASFVSCVPSERPFAVPANANFYVMARHQKIARRLVARKGTSMTF